jgi:hypothetical protein
MDLSVVEEPVLAILMNNDNQTITVKVNNSKDFIMACKEAAKVYQKNEKLWSDSFGLSGGARILKLGIPISPTKKV